MNFFPIDLRKLLFVVIVIALPLFFFSQDSKNQETPWYAVPFSLAGGLVQSSYFWLDNGVRDTVQQYFNLLSVKTENKALKAENLSIKTSLTLFNELKEENKRLQNLLNFQASSGMDMIPARVIGVDLLTEHLTISINRGAKHGVSKGQAVATTEGVVGYILRAEPMNSLVLLITDRYAVIDALVQRTRARGLVEGMGPGKASLRYLERIDDVKVGDIVVTNGWNEVFPKGFPVAKVIGVEKANYDVSVEVDLQPIVDTNTVEEVFVITKSNAKNFLPEDTSSEEEKSPGDAP